MPNFADVPYRYSKDMATFDDLLLASQSRTVRILQLGSSLHNPISSNGQRLAATQGASLHDVYGNNPGSDLACISDATLASSSTKFLVRSGVGDTGTSTGGTGNGWLPTTYVPPGWNLRYISQGTTGNKGALMKLIPNGAVLATAGYRTGTYLPTTPGGPTTCRVNMWAAKYTGTSGGLLYEIRASASTAAGWTGTVIDSGTLATAAELSDASDYALVKKTVDISYASGTAYIEVIIVGDSATAGQGIGVDFQSLSNPVGIQLINASQGNFSAGGVRSGSTPTDSNSILVSRDDCFKLIKDFDIDALLICYGTNDSDPGTPADKDDFQANLQDLIDLARTDMATTIPVILASDPAWWDDSGGTEPTAGEQTAITEYPVATHAIAGSYDKVLHVNVHRTLADSGWNYDNSANAAALFTSDGKHHSDAGASRYGAALVKGIIGGPTLPGFSSLSAGLLAAMNAAPPDVNVATLDSAAVTAIGNASVTIVPAIGTTSDRAGDDFILAYTAETGKVSITVLDSARDPVDMTGKTLAFYLETEVDHTVIASVTSGFTIASNVVSFAIPSEATETNQKLIFALRDAASPKSVYAGGIFRVDYLPYGGA